MICFRGIEAELALQQLIDETEESGTSHVADHPWAGRFEHRVRFCTGEVCKMWRAFKVVDCELHIADFSSQEKAAAFEHEGEAQHEY